MSRERVHRKSSNQESVHRLTMNPTLNRTFSVFYERVLGSSKN